jgi:hypothetical protein
MPNMTLKLGVIDLPYSSAYVPDKKIPMTPGQRRFHPRYNQALTTGDVAEILEDKYGIMQYFFDQHKDFIIEELTKSMVNSFKRSLKERSPRSSMFYLAASEKIEQRFKKALSQKEFDGLEGVPTKASLLGVSHRFKNPYAKRASRPSFIDTGLYQSAFKVWM